MVCCMAGDLIVWDSRLVHCNTPASPKAVDSFLKQQQQQACSTNARLPKVSHGEPTPEELIRMVGYICMVPAARANDNVIQSRVMAYSSSTQTSHWPDTYVQPMYTPSGELWAPQAIGLKDPTSLGRGQWELIAGKRSKQNATGRTTATRSRCLLS